MACTLRIAADTAKFGQPEINLGLIPGYAGSQRLPRLVGRGRALELLLTGMQITADEALRIGLVNRVVPAADLANEARKLAHAIAAKAPVAVRYILDAVAAGSEMPLAEAQRYEATLFGLVSTTEDMREGTRAFLEKRSPASSKAGETHCLPCSLVVVEYHAFVTDRLEAGARDALTEADPSHRSREFYRAWTVRAGASGASACGVRGLVARLSVSAA